MTTGSAHALCLRRFVVGFFFHDFRQIADDKGPEVRHAERGDDANIVRADRNVLGNADFEFAGPGGLGGDAGVAEIEPAGVGQFAAREDAIDRGSLPAAAREDAVEAWNLQLGVGGGDEGEQDHGGESVAVA